MSLSHCCRLFEISRQGFYQMIKRKELRAKELQKVKHLVQQIRMIMPRLGTRKLYFLLKDKFEMHGIKIGRDALFNFLQSESLLVKPKKNYTRTTNSKHWLRKYDNLFIDKDITKPEQYFVSDITYIKSREKTHYLSLVTDAYSRKIMGYHLSENMNSENVAMALKMAIKNRVYNTKLIHHSDRGLQYCSEHYQAILSKNKIKPSMTTGYDCYQNALAERINGILKNEFLIYKCKNFKELRELIKESVHIYNKFRPHLSLNMKTPNFVHNNKKPEKINPLALL